MNNWDMAQNVILQRLWPWKVKVIPVQNKWYHWIPWPEKHVYWLQNCHPKCLSSKVTIKDVFLHNGGQCNAFAYVSHSNLSRCFWFIKRPDPSYPMLKVCDNLSSMNWDMAQNVILQGCDLERSRSSVKVKKFFFIKPQPLTHKYTCAVSLKSCNFPATVSQALTEKWSGEEEIKNMPETLWHRLTPCRWSLILSGSRIDSHWRFWCLDLYL